MLLNLRSIACLAVVVVASGCASLQVTPGDSPAAQFRSPVTFVGAYDARAQTGGVETQRLQTNYNYAATPGGGGFLYPTTTVVRTGEIEPNLMIQNVASGFVSAAEDGRVFDASGDTPLEARGEMGMDWLAKNRKTERYIIGVEVKDARVNLDGAQGNYTLGLTATILGVLSPLLFCMTAPCLLYLPFAKTVADANATGVVRVYDREKGEIVYRSTVSAQAATATQGFHDPEAVYAMLAREVGQRLGKNAAAAAANAGYR
jgi:hypothetical protein